MTTLVNNMNEDNELETLTLDDIKDIIESAFYDDDDNRQPLDFNDDTSESP